ncbi:MAG: hypothetical protein HMLIMOIP_002227 [Candidatus Nitrosomirales archaeon]|jgi:hypothetical protein
MKKKAIVGIALGVIMLSSMVGAISFPSDSSKINDIEKKRKEKLDFIDNASIEWQQGIVGKEEFISVIQQSVIDTDVLRQEYQTLSLPQKYDRYKSLSVESLNIQKDAFLKLKEYVEAGDPDTQELKRSEFDQLMVASIQYHNQALRELES